MAFRELSPAQQEQLLRFRQLESTLQNIKIQQAEINRVLQEIEMTKKELQKLDPETEVWKSIGSVMFPKKASEVLKELSDRSELLEINLKRLKSQEADSKKRLEDLQNRLTSQLGAQSSN
ncbi:MAG: prefoldin subunit beta [Candidatus Hodarchaeales archaeon]